MKRFASSVAVLSVVAIGVVCACGKKSPPPDMPEPQRSIWNTYSELRQSLKDEDYQTAAAMISSSSALSSREPETSALFLDRFSHWESDGRIELPEVNQILDFVVLDTDSAFLSLGNPQHPDTLTLRLESGIWRFVI